MQNKLVQAAPGLELNRGNRPDAKDLTATDRALIARGGAVGFRKVGDTYVKTYRQPTESDRLRAEHKRIMARVNALKGKHL